MPIKEKKNERKEELIKAIDKFEQSIHELEELLKSHKKKTNVIKPAIRQ